MAVNNASFMPNSPSGPAMRNYITLWMTSGTFDDGMGNVIGQTWLNDTKESLDAMVPWFDGTTGFTTALGADGKPQYGRYWLVLNKVNVIGIAFEAYNFQQVSLPIDPTVPSGVIWGPWAPKVGPGSTL